MTTHDSIATPDVTPDATSQALERLVQRFEAAVVDNDVEGYVALHTEPLRATVDRARFAHNVRQFKAGGWRFVLRSARFAGDTAVAEVEICTKQGEHVDQVSLTLVRLGDEFQLVET